MSGIKKNKVETLKANTINRNLKRLKSKKPIIAAARSFVFSPTFNVVVLACLIIAVFAGIRVFSARRNSAQIAFVEQAEIDQAETANADDRKFSAPEIFRGEVYDTSVRLRETGALGMAISLTVFAEYSEKKNIPTNLETIFSSVRERNLMPPEMTLNNGQLASASNKFVVRYKPQPLAFEILSSPKNNATSPAILLRFPLASLDKRTITYFQSARANRFDAPEPFAPLEKIVAAGWTIEQWRGELLPKGENAPQLLAEEKRLLSEATTNH